MCLGEGLLLSDGHVWKSERRIANKAFHHESLLKMAGLIEEACNTKIKEWKSSLEQTSGNSLKVE